jgi:hypothetical protein
VGGGSTSGGGGDGVQRIDRGHLSAGIVVDAGGDAAQGVDPGDLAVSRVEAERWSLRHGSVVGECRASELRAGDQLDIIASSMVRAKPFRS